MTVIVVRHGESRGNHLRIIQGTLDEPLTEIGVTQAEAVAGRLSSFDVAALYASPLVRAYHTAEPIAARLRLPIVSVTELQERHFGDAQGLTAEQRGERWPARAVHDRDWAADIPGVEPIDELRRRAARVLDELLERHAGETAVAVSHGGTITQMIAHALGLPGGVTPRIRLGNTSLTTFDGPPGTPVLTMLNDRCHLGREERTSPPAM